MSRLTLVLLGAGLGLLLVAWARRRAAGRERRVYAWALVVAAAIYAGFALAGGDPPWIGVEAAGLALFAAAAWLGWTRSAWWLSAGWAAHVAWDLGLHGGGEPAFVPAWYPWLCVGFDPVVAAAVAWPMREAVDGGASARYAP